MLARQNTTSMAHEQIISKLDRAAQVLYILIIKTDRRCLTHPSSYSYELLTGEMRRSKNFERVCAATEMIQPFRRLDDDITRIGE